MVSGGLLMGEATSGHPPTASSKLSLSAAMRARDVTRVDPGLADGERPFDDTAAQRLIPEDAPDAEGAETGTGQAVGGGGSSGSSPVSS